MNRLLAFAVVASLMMAASGCIQVKTHSTIDPVHITLDVNLRVKLDKELANAFGDIDAASTTVK